MNDQKNKIEDSVVNVSLQEELQSSFIDYAVSVIVSRAIPDVRDGLKPVHRRILYTMEKLGFSYNKPYHKSVRIVGDVLGKYHPHGDQAVYQAMVGMVQDFSRRYPLLDGQGNWGSVDGDNAAAMRYTEIRMERICEEILSDIEKDTVPFVPNFDDSTVEPALLPSKIPTLLINGTTGIAVGMATSVPPHNLTEVLDALIALIENPTLTISDLMHFIKGPDFPTSGIICNTKGIVKAYHEGRGSVMVRGVVEIEEIKNNHAIVITQLPYQVVKAHLIEHVAQLVRDKVIEGIANIRDESNKKGMRVVIELKRDAHVETIINLLYKHTSLQTNITIMLLALIDNQPKIFNLKEMLVAFINHRREIVSRRTRFEIEKAKHQEHILAGIQIILDAVEEAINIIRFSQDAEDAMQKLQDKFGLSSKQSKAILELRLQRFTSLEREKIVEERKNLLAFIEKLANILEDKTELERVIVEEMKAIKERYGDARRTAISYTESGDFDESAFIADDEVVITLTQKGYIKRVGLDVYAIQHRGGKGKMGTASLEETDDVIQDIFIAKNHDSLLFFTNLGRVYHKEVFKVPEGSRTSKGRAVVNVLPLAPGEKVVKLLCARELTGLNLLLITKWGTVKRTEAGQFEDIRQTGIRAITLNDGDELAFCLLTSGEDSIIVGSKNGQGIRFLEKEVRVMGRQAAGVRAIRLDEKDEVVGVQVTEAGKDILFVTERGYGKRVSQEEFRVAHRGGKGVKTIPTNERNGTVVGIASVDSRTTIILIDQNGKILRIPPEEIRTMRRQAQGVRLINLEPTQYVSCVATLDEGGTVPAEPFPVGPTDNLDVLNDSDNLDNNDIDDQNEELEDQNENTEE